MKLNRKQVKMLKSTLVVGFMNQMASPEGLVITWTCEGRGQEVFVVNDEDRRVVLPASFHAGIDDPGWVDYTRADLASELAKRQVRDMFPDQADFITWAWYN